MTLLLHRSVRLAIRQSDVIIAQFALAILMALLIGFAFYQLSPIPTNLPVMSSALFFCAINQGLFGALMVC
jgi:hypothetical protein